MEDKEHIYQEVEPWRRLKSENGTDAGSESRSKIYFDYAEQQGGKDREAGLKLKTNIPPPERCSSSPYLRGTKRA